MGVILEADASIPPIPHPTAWNNCKNVVSMPSCANLRRQIITDRVHWPSNHKNGKFRNNYMYCRSGGITNWARFLLFSLVRSTFLNSQEETDGGRSCKTCLRRKIHNLIFAALLVANSYCRQTHIMNMTHNIWTSAGLAPSSFNFGLPTYFVPHYGCRRALYTVFYRRVLSSHSRTLWLLCSKYVMSISDKQSSCWSARC